jgi:hypothetical protein
MKSFDRTDGGDAPICGHEPGFPGLSCQVACCQAKQHCRSLNMQNHPQEPTSGSADGPGYANGPAGREGGTRLGPGCRRPGRIRRVVPCLASEVVPGLARTASDARRGRPGWPAWARKIVLPGGAAPAGGPAARCGPASSAARCIAAARSASSMPSAPSSSSCAVGLLCAGGEPAGTTGLLPRWVQKQAPSGLGRLRVGARACLTCEDSGSGSAPRYCAAIRQYKRSKIKNEDYNMPLSCGDVEL